MPSKEPLSIIQKERLPNLVFRLMDLTFILSDIFFPRLDGQVKEFGIKEGMTVVDYGCGPGRYTVRFARLTGETGMVYAVDIHELAIKGVARKMNKLGLGNVTPLLAEGYNSGVPDYAADVVCALDMFFMIQQPADFLAELHRITKPDGCLVIDDGHQPRPVTIERILESGLWDIWQETPDHLKCRPL